MNIIYKMGKVWKNGGQEDQVIKKLIRSGKINKYTKPSSLKNNYVRTFGDFSLNVIRNHLNLLKMSEGLMGELLNDQIHAFSIVKTRFFYQLVRKMKLTKTSS